MKTAKEMVSLPFVETRHRSSGIPFCPSAIGGALCALLAFSPVQLPAASFDCGKAITQIEKRICSDLELSSLDEKLAAAYKRALDVSADKESLRRQQRKWVGARDACSDADCLRAAYLVHIAHFRDTAKKPPSQSNTLRLKTAVAASTVIRYPPYTDAWELKVPLSQNVDLLPRIRSARLENGDVMLGFVPPTKSVNRRSIAGISSANLAWLTFFSRQTATVDQTTAAIRLEDGSLVRSLKQSRSESNYPGAAELEDGTYVVSSRDVSHDCYKGPARSTLKRYQSRPRKDANLRPKLLATKVVFLVLDEPVAWSGAGYHLCDEADKKLFIRVVALQGNVIPLDDGGFLIVDENVGWVFRFNADLSTRTSLLGKKLFAFDLEPSMGPLFIDKVTGKSYLNEQGNVQMQRVLDDLYDFLIRLKGEK